MTLFSWLGVLGLGVVMCVIMWFYGREKYKEGWSDGFGTNLGIKLADIKNGLAETVKVYSIDPEIEIKEED